MSSVVFAWCNLGGLGVPRDHQRLFVFLALVWFRA